MKKTAFLFLVVIIFSAVKSNGQVQIGSDIDGENLEDLSGYTVAISATGNVLAIGAIENDDGVNRSQVRVYQNLNGIWTQLGEDFAGVWAGERIGYSVSLNGEGNSVEIVAPQNNEKSHNFSNDKQ
jgi:hypothetical protein